MTAVAENTVATPTEQNGTLAHQNGQETTRNRERFVAPPVDIYETENGLTVLADLPGVSKENLDIQVKDDLLTIQARTTQNTPGEPVRREFELVNFFRQFRLAETVDVNRIQAELKHGVLTLNLPKAEAAKPKRIEVQVN